jgi:hypothetical protein
MITEAATGIIASQAIRAGIPDVASVTVHADRPREAHLATQTTCHIIAGEAPRRNDHLAGGAGGGVREVPSIVTVLADATTIAILASKA